MRRSSDAEDGPGRARRLARRLEGVRETGQRSVLVREFCTGREPGEAVEGLHQLLAEVLRGRYHGAWLAVVRVIADDGLPYERVEELYRAAVRDGYHPIRYLLMGSSTAHRRAAEGEFGRDDALESLPIGTRRAHARRLEPRMLERLLHDPEPMVVRTLLDNPRLTEENVLRLAAGRPNRAAVLRELVRARRWIQRRRIQRAVVLNPYAPVQLAVALLPLLRPSEIDEIAREEGLSPLLGVAARSLLELRGWEHPTLH